MLEDGCYQKWLISLLILFVYMYAYSKVVGNGMENDKNWGSVNVGNIGRIGLAWIGLDTQGGLLLIL
jgi:hypothetical protein